MAGRTISRLQILNFHRQFHLGPKRYKKKSKICPPEPPTPKPPVKPDVCKDIEQPCHPITVDPCLKLEKICHAPCAVCPCPITSICREDEPIPKHYKTSHSRSPFEARVIVIGAGIAGLSAAERLVACGCPNVDILEASGRPGGRIKSSWMCDSVIEEGTDFPLVDFWESPIMEMAVADGVTTRPISQCDPSFGLLLDIDGRPLPLPLAINAYRQFRDILKSLTFLKNNVLSEADYGKINGYVGSRIEQALREYRTRDALSAAKVLVALLRLARDSFAPGLCSIAKDKFGVYMEIYGSNIRVPIGHTGVISPMLRLIGDRIQYNKEVTCIQWGALESDTSPRAVVRCSDGTKYQGDHVIITLPLGVLKKRLEQLFCPSLPPKKVKVIECMEFNLKAKAFFQFDLPLYTFRDFPFDIEFDPETLCKMPAWGKSITRIYERCGTQGVLTVEIGGCASLEAETNAPEDNIRIITCILNNLISGKVPRPSKVLISKWGTNKFYLGAQSCSDSEKETMILAESLPSEGEPMPGILFFAGEATCVGLNGTVHGARLSGVREAEKILNMMRSQPWAEDAASVQATA